MTDAVIVRYALTGGPFGTTDGRAAVYALQERLTAALAGLDVGDLDGNEFGGDEVSVYLYGPDADRLYDAVEPVLRSLPARPARATLRYGEAGDPEAVRYEIDLDTGRVEPPPARPKPGKRRKIVAAEGDVFRIPIDDVRSVYGQVVAKHDSSTLVVVFDALSLDAVDGADVLLLANTFDDCLVDGEWPIVGHRLVRADVPWPVYKFWGSIRPPEIVDHFGRVLREATPEEARTLRSRSQSTANTVTDAAKAAFGVGEWRDAYDKFLPDERATVARVIGTT
ncbi:Imm26 family immunity protein [Dactylosporangium sp. CS-047395]|uniref:Imm26 family immunity protein n=1 Tax=Dactylosporangium sp. CS-047395 TaxID=3239936 RepID=UPI003D91F9CD